MPTYYSDWTSLAVARYESATAEYPATVFDSIYGTLEVSRFASDPALLGPSTHKRPGGFLAWTVQLASGETQLRACRVHDTVECTILTDIPLDSTSLISTRGSDATLGSGMSPVRTSPAVRVNGQGEPLVGCVAADIAMTAFEEGVEEEGRVELPSQYAVRKFKTAGIEAKTTPVYCSYLESGNIYALTGAVEPAISSSSSSSVATKSSSSLSSSIATKSSSSSSSVATKSSSSSSSSVVTKSSSST